MSHVREPMRGWIPPTSGLHAHGAMLLAILLLSAGPARAASRGDSKGITDGTAKNGMTYHLAVPPAYDARKGLPAIVILHGSNMSSKAYVQTILSTWPKLAQRYIIYRHQRREPRVGGSVRRGKILWRAAGNRRQRKRLSRQRS